MSKLHCAKGSRGVNCTVQRVQGEDNFNKMKVSSVLVPHIANDSSEKEIIVHYFNCICMQYLILSLL